MEKDRTCKYCNKFFEKIDGRLFSNHVRWCPQNQNGDKGIKKLSDAATKRYERLNGKKQEFTVICQVCKILFTIVEPENKFPTKSKYYCSRPCANYREHNLTYNKNISNGMKLKWKDDPIYAHKCTSRIHKTRFNSKGEIEMRNYFLEMYPGDEWTHGGGLRIIDNIFASRDLYSNKLKISVEYDGIWHFKDICGQLARKQEKDKQLEEWSISNCWRLVRIKDEIYIKDPKKWNIELAKIIYNTSDQIVKIY